MSASCPESDHFGKHIRIRCCQKIDFHFAISVHGGIGFLHDHRAAVFLVKGSDRAVDTGNAFAVICIIQYDKGVIVP